MVEDVLHLSACHSFATSDPHLPNVDVSHSVLVVLSLVLARCDRRSIRHLLLCRDPLAHTLHLFQLELFFLSFTRSVSATLSLYAFILALPVMVLSMIDPQVGSVESLLHQHTLESPHLEMISCSVHCRISK